MFFYAIFKFEKIKKFVSWSHSIISNGNMQHRGSVQASNPVALGSNLNTPKKVLLRKVNGTECKTLSLHSEEAD